MLCMTTLAALRVPVTTANSTKSPKGGDRAGTASVRDRRVRSPDRDRSGTPTSGSHHGLSVGPSVGGSRGGMLAAHSSAVGGSAGAAGLRRGLQSRGSHVGGPGATTGVGASMATPATLSAATHLGLNLSSLRADGRASAVSPPRSGSSSGGVRRDSGLAQIGLASQAGGMMNVVAPSRARGGMGSTLGSRGGGSIMGGGGGGGAASVASSVASSIVSGVSGTSSFIRGSVGVVGGAAGGGGARWSGVDTVPSGMSTVTGLITGARDGSLKVWNLATGECVRTMRGHGRAVLAVRLPPGPHSVPDGSFFTFMGAISELGGANGGGGASSVTGMSPRRGSVATILTATSQATGGGDGGHKWGVDGSRLAGTTGGGGGGGGGVMATMGDVTTPRSVFSTSSVSPRSAPHHVGHVMSCSADGTLRLWNYETGRALRMFEGHRGAVTCMDWGMYNIAVSGGVDGTLRVWNVNTGLCLHVVPHDPPAALTRLVWKGEWVLGGYKDGSISFWRWVDACG